MQRVEDTASNIAQSSGRMLNNPEDTKEVVDNTLSAGKTAAKTGGAVAGAAIGTAVLPGLGTVVGGAVGGAVGASAVSLAVQPLIDAVSAGNEYLEKMSSDSLGSETVAANIESELALFTDSVERNFRVDDLTAAFVEEKTELTLALRDLGEQVMTEIGPLIITMLKSIQGGVKLVSIIVDVLTYIKDILLKIPLFSDIGELLGDIAENVSRTADETEKRNNNSSVSQSIIDEVKTFFNTQDQFEDENGNPLFTFPTF